ncbi:ATP-binding cassette domain-containing protein [Streptomyces sp. NBC_01220]|uniref:ATP-binding cassette domain-containing protein n=1 Tax=Streptomyces sp. NBC_01220 TaxID=2903781 RepID=UPI00352D1CEE|nr:ATP-binding cassette domain-containing protein [Streptomyces sp. NBC_01220]
MNSPHGAAVTAEGLGLKGPRGWAFRGVTFSAAPGSLIAIEGPSGSGRTCLLLALTGRMRPTEGEASTGGLRLPRRAAAVRRVAALGSVPGVSELDPAFTVTEHLRERALLQRRFDTSLRALLRPRRERVAAAGARVDSALKAAGLDTAALPKAGRTSVRDLERLEALRLSIALALIGRPRLLAVDDTDLKLSDAERAEAWELLRHLAADGTTVLAVCSQAPDDAVTVRTGTTGTADDTGTTETTTPADDTSTTDTTAPADNTSTTDTTAPADNTSTTDTTAPAATTGEPAQPAASALDEGTADAFAETGRA